MDMVVGAVGTKGMEVEEEAVGTKAIEADEEEAVDEVDGVVEEGGEVADVTIGVFLIVNR